MLRGLIYKTIKLFGSAEAKALERATHDPLKAQNDHLNSILKQNQATQFGSEHGFASIKSIADFQRAVPVRSYEEFSPYIDRMCHGEKGILTKEDPVMFATTSGTTSAQKFIPITGSYIKEFRRASVATGYHLINNFPGVTAGYVLPVVSPAEEGRTPCGTPYGAISGHLYQSEPAIVKSCVTPLPYDVYLIRDYESRYYALLRTALNLPLSVLYTMNPSTILMLARRLERYGPQLVKDIYDGTLTTPNEIPQEIRQSLSRLCKADKERARELEALINRGQLIPKNVWMNLQTICCWTRAAASFYIADFPQYFGDVPVCDISYAASEGRGTVTLSPDKQVLSLRSHFFEFIPEEEIESVNPQVLTCDQLTVGRNYYILFTTSGGLYRYNINDVVKVVGYHNQAPLIEFQYKGGNVCSFTGEKITELQVTEAMKRVLGEMSQKVAFFTLIPQFRPNPHYVLWVEPISGTLLEQCADSGNGNGHGNGDNGKGHGEGSVSLELARRFDRELGHQNIEYKSKRESDRLDEVAIRLVEPGSYEAFRQLMTSRGVPDAQIKVSHLNPKAEIRQYFELRLLAAKVNQSLSNTGDHGRISQ
jgi:hypothetical protein